MNQFNTDDILLIISQEADCEKIVLSLQPKKIITLNIYSSFTVVKKELYNVKNKTIYIVDDLYRYFARLVRLLSCQNNYLSIITSPDTLVLSLNLPQFRNASDYKHADIIMGGAADGDRKVIMALLKRPVIKTTKQANKIRDYVDIEMSHLDDHTSIDNTEMIQKMNPFHYVTHAELKNYLPLLSKWQLIKMLFMRQKYNNTSTYLIIKIIIISITVLLIALLITSCGSKGMLYYPEDEIVPAQQEIEIKKLNDSRS